MHLWFSKRWPIWPQGKSWEDLDQSLERTSKETGWIWIEREYIDVIHYKYWLEWMNDMQVGKQANLGWDWELERLNIFVANFLLISCRCLIVLFCYFLSLSQSSHGQTLCLLWPSSCRRRRLLKQRFQFDRDLLVVYDPKERPFGIRISSSCLVLL